MVVIAVAVVVAWLASNVAIVTATARLERRVHAIERARRLHTAAGPTVIPFEPEPLPAASAN